MKPNFLKTDSDSDSLIQKLNFQFTNVNASNFNGRTITGTTNPVANTQFLVKHGFTVAPRLELLRIGNVYIQSIDNTYIDVRSMLPSIYFEITLA